MKTILFITNHPAPYMNRWFELLDKENKVFVLYYYYSAIYKRWENFEPYKGDYLNDMSIFSLIRTLLKSDFTILCGIDKPKYWLSLFTLILKKKNFALYSDYPVSNNRKTHVFKKVLLNRFIPFLFCATESTAEYYIKTYNILDHKIRVFPYAHNFELGNSKDINSLRMKCLENGDKIRVFIANSFYKRKGYSILYDALKKLKTNNMIDEFEFKFAGVGDDYNYYKELFLELNSNTFFLGWVEDNIYNHLMKQTDIFVHASLFEPFGIPPLDALECGKLLIVSNGVKSVDLIVESGINGFIYSGDNSEELYNIFVQVLKDKSQIYRIGNVGRQSVRTHYPEDKIKHSLNSCFDN